MGEKSFVVLVERGDRQWVIPLRKDPVRIGRSPNNHVCVEDSQIAPRHLRFVPLGDDIWVTDKWSPEGFYWNGQLVRECRVKPGDEVSVGQLKAYLLIQEGASDLPVPEPIAEIEAPEAPPMPVRPKALAKKSKAVWVAGLIVLLLGGAGYLGFLVYEKSQTQQQQEKYELLLGKARDAAKEKSWQRAKNILSQVPRQFPEWDARVRALEKEIQNLMEEEEKQRLKLYGDEYYERYLKNLLSSALIRSDVRWELIAWRRCEEFLRSFPGHAKSSLVQSTRNRIAAGAKAPPAPTLQEVEVDVKDLLESASPNYAMARRSVLALIQANLGEDTDLKGRRLLAQIDSKASDYLERKLSEAREQWNAGNHEMVNRMLDRLARELGKDEFVERIGQFQTQLNQ